MILNIILAILPPTRFFVLKRFVLRLLGVRVGSGSSICGRVKFYGAGRVEIGQDCWIGIGNAFHTAKDADIYVGDRCDFAPDVILICGSHEMGGPERRAGKGIAHTVRIGSGTWIGVRAVLLGGSEIGPGSMIGAGALVLGRRYPPSSLIFGSPAKVVKSFDSQPAGSI